MEEMIFSYDKEGDVLDISIGLPKKALSKEISEDFFVRIDKQGSIVGFMMLNFEKRFQHKTQEKIPLTAKFLLPNGLAA